MRIYFGWETAGLISFSFKNFTIHLFCSRKFWIWGYQGSWYDGPLHCFGVGPLFLITI